jgi:hypothetical protein
MAQFDYQRVKAEVHDYCSMADFNTFDEEGIVSVDSLCQSESRKGGKAMKQVKFLVSGWNVQPDGSYHIFKKLCGIEQAQIYLRLATMHDDDTIAIKVDNIEVIWNAE